MRSFILIVYISLSVTNLYAQVPNQFSAGDAVSAEKINENFTYASKRIYLKNDNNTIGTIIEVSEGQWGNGYFVTSKGYFYLNLANIFIGNVQMEGQGQYVYYSTNDCSGTAYATDSPKFNRLFFTYDQIYYISANTSSTPNIIMRTYKTAQSTSCQTIARPGSGTNLYALTNNDESITGFPDTIGTLSISYE